MKRQLKSMLLLVTVSFIILISCRKHEELITTIKQVSLTVDKDGTERGTFVASGEIQTSGNFVMEVKLVGTDSFYCTNKLIAPEGSFTTNMHCSGTTMTGSWRVLSSTGKYASLKGGGTLVMSYPPGVVGIEILTGKVSFGW